MRWTLPCFFRRRVASKPCFISLAFLTSSGRFDAAHRLPCPALPPHSLPVSPLASPPRFFDLLRTYFPCFYDIKYLMTACQGLHGGLQRIGTRHPSSHPRLYYLLLVPAHIPSQGIPSLYLLLLHSTHDLARGSIPPSFPQPKSSQWPAWGPCTKQAATPS